MLALCSLLAVLVLALASHPGQVALRTLLLLPDLFPGSPVRPLTLLSGPPTMIEHNYTIPTGTVEADVYLPAGGGRHGAMVMLLGAVGFPRRDPVLLRLADGLSRAGMVVMIPESSGLQNGVIDPREVDGLVEAVRFLAERPEVDPRRIGIFGFSVGGSIALLAAQDERARDRLAFVNAFGAYYDARDFLSAVVTGRLRTDEGTRPWQPSDLTVWVFRKQLIEPLPDGEDRAILARLFLDKDESARAEAARLSERGQVLLRLLDREHESEQEVEAALAQLPEASQRLAAISPSAGMSRLRSRLYLMHDRSDAYIPYTESRRLAAAAPPGTLQAHTEFDLFSHVMPGKPLEPLDFAREALKLYAHVYRLCLELL